MERVTDRGLVVRPRLFIRQPPRIPDNNHGWPNPVCTFLPFPTSFQPKREAGGRDPSVRGRFYADERLLYVCDPNQKLSAGGGGTRMMEAHNYNKDACYSWSRKEETKLRMNNCCIPFLGLYVVS